MIIPKRFKMFMAASTKPQPETGMHLNTIHVLDSALVASDGVSAAWVPIMEPNQSAGRELPRLEVGEIKPNGAVLPLSAFKEAVRGKSGHGLLRISEHATEAQTAPGKPWIRTENPHRDGSVPNFDHVFETVSLKAPETHQYVEVCLDAQQLANVAAAIGAESSVRLSFLVNRKTGRADAGGDAHGVIDVRPLDNIGSQGVLMIQVHNG